MVIFGIGYIFIQMYFFKKLMKHPELAEEKAQSAKANAEENA